MAEIDLENVDDAADMLLKRWEKPEAKAAPSASSAPKAQAHSPSPVVEDDVPDDEEDIEEDEVEPGPLADDEHEVEVGDRRVKVAALKALAAREEDITSKHAVATQAAEKAVAEQQKHSVAVNALLDRARQRWEPYSKVDFLVAQKELTSEEFAALRASASAAYQDVQFLEAELDNSVKETQTKQQQTLVAAAQDCIKVLADPEHGIKDWSPTVYKDLRTYALGMGVNQKVFDLMVDPVAFKVIHKAMLYDKAQKSAMKKVVSAPKNVNKTTTAGATTSPSRNKVRSTMEALRKSGDTDAAAEALLARWAQ